jgi:hypothetical protein
MGIGAERALAGREARWHIDDTSKILGWIAVVAAAMPLLFLVPAPMQDWPSHLARLHIMSQMMAGQSDWQRFYQINTFFLPNVVLDVGLLGLMGLGLTLNAASVGFLLLTYVLFVGGFCALCGAFRAFDTSKLVLGGVLFFNVSLFWGFINFQFGLALALALAALWARAGLFVVRLAIAVLGAAAVCMCHLVAAGAFLVLLGSIELVRFTRAPSWRGLLLNTTSIIAALVVFGLLRASPTSHENLTSMVFVNAGSIPGIARWKLSLLVKALLGGGRAADIVTVAGLALAIIAVLLGARVRFGGVAVVAVLASVALCVASPFQIGSGAVLDERLGVLPLIAAAALLRFDWRSRHAQFAVVAMLACVVLLRSALIWRDWHADAAVTQDFAAKTATLPAGSTVMTATGQREVPWSTLWSPPMMQLAAKAALHDVFVPTVFADPTQQPLALRPEWRRWGHMLELVDRPQLADGLAALHTLCGRLDGNRGSGRVYLLVLYPNDMVQGALAADPVVWRSGNAQLVDACRAVR